MAERKYILPGGENIEIGYAAADALIARGDGCAVLLYVYILRNHGAISVKEAMQDLQRSHTEIDAAMRVLADLHLIQYDGAPSQEVPVRDELPEYTVGDIQRELESGAVFPMLVQEVQKAMGRILSSDDLMKLFGIYDSLGLPPEVILHLVNHCVSECGAKDGSHRRPTMRYIEKAAYTWEREGIFTIPAAEAYIRRGEQYKEGAAEFKRVLQIHDRALTATEKRYIKDWLDMGFGADAVEIAYDRTVLKTGKLAWSYMNSILKNWHEKKLHTPEEIQKGDTRPGRESSQARTKTGGPTPEEIARMKRMLENIEK